MNGAYDVKKEAKVAYKTQYDGKRALKFFFFAQPILKSA